MLILCTKKGIHNEDNEIDESKKRTVNYLIVFEIFFFSNCDDYYLHTKIDIFSFLFVLLLLLVLLCDGVAMRVSSTTHSHD